MLGCAIAEELFRRFPQLPEGRLTQFRAALVRRETLAHIAEEIDLGGHLQLGAHTPPGPSILANAVEAVIGAIFLDGGYDAARKSVLRLFDQLLSQLNPQTVLKDPKSRLNELLYSQGKQHPEYVTVKAEGPHNQRTFEVRCVSKDLDVETSGRGTSLQRAQQDAARAMLEKLGA